MIADEINCFISSLSKSFTPQNLWMEDTCSSCQEPYRNNAYRNGKTPVPLLLLVVFQQAKFAGILFDGPNVLSLFVNGLISMVLLLTNLSTLEVDSEIIYENIYLSSFLSLWGIIYSGA